MKFFEYPDRNGSYYALIAANSKDESNAEYLEGVGEIDDDYPGPNEITEEEAREKYDKAVVEDSDGAYSFDDDVSRAPTILLIDSDLI